MQIVIFVTASSSKEAKLIAGSLIKAKLAACVNIIPAVNSLFWWNKKVDSAQEALLLIKSKRSKLPQIIKKVKTLHSYEVPEIIALPIIGGDKKYLYWIDESLR